MENQQPLQNAVATLVLGICSIIFGCFFVGLICGIIALAISGKSKHLYIQNPSQYSGYGMLNAGRILSIIGIVLGGITVLYTIISVAFLGAGMFEWMNLINA